MTAAVLGLGLIGGSLARDLVAAGIDVIGWDRDAETMEAARHAIAIRPIRSPADAGAAELVILAVPVRAAPRLLRELAPALEPETVVTDVGSTKRSVASAAKALGLAGRFAGSHPMAGDHRSGWGASRAGLFRGARVWVCPETAASDAAGRVRRLWEGVGGEVHEIDAAAHDRLMAWASHLPQALGSALGATLAAGGVRPDQLGPGGRETSRLAGSDASVWTQVLLDNRDEVLPALDALTTQLDRLRHALRQEDEGELDAWLREARRWSE